MPKSITGVWFSVGGVVSWGYNVLIVYGSHILRSMYEGSAPRAADRTRKNATKTYVKGTEKRGPWFSATS